MSSPINAVSNRPAVAEVGPSRGATRPDAVRDGGRPDAAQQAKPKDKSSFCCGKGCCSKGQTASKIAALNLDPSALLQQLSQTNRAA